MRNMRSARPVLASVGVNGLNNADNVCTQTDTSPKCNTIIEANALRSREKRKKKEAHDAKKEAEVITKKLKLQ